MRMMTKRARVLVEVGLAEEINSPVVADRKAKKNSGRSEKSSR
jgi:hypothetical protein